MSRNLKASEDQTGGELLESFRGHLCWVYWENPLWPWLWPVKALCAHFHHLMTAQIMPTTASGVQPRKIMNNKCSSECHQSFQSVFMSSPRGEVQPGGIPDHFHLSSSPGTLLQPSRFPIKDNNSTGNGEPKVLWLLKQETPEKY